MKQIVSANIFEPTNALFKEHRKGRSEVRLVHCEKSAECELYKKGQCALLGVLGGSNCPYGKVTRESGPTPRARNYYTWISDQKKKHEGIQRLGTAGNVLAKVGDYVFLPYSFMGKNENVPFVDGAKSFMSSSGSFIAIADFTPDNIYELAIYRPEALFGGEIRSYQAEEVPKFLKHLSENLVDSFNAFVAKYPQYEKFRTTTNVGREAYLSSLNPNVGQFKDIHGGLWNWDGTYLTSTNSKIYFALVSKFEEVRIKPTGEHKVKITNDGQVGPNTKFLD